MGNVMARPTLQVEFEPLTADDLTLLATAVRSKDYLEARSIVRIGRLQRYLNTWLDNSSKLYVDGRAGPLTIKWLDTISTDNGPFLDDETRWYVDRVRQSHQP